MSFLSRLSMIYECRRKSTDSEMLRVARVDQPPLPFVLGTEFAGRISKDSPIPKGCPYKPGGTPILCDFSCDDPEDRRLTSPDRLCSQIKSSEQPKEPTPRPSSPTPLCAFRSHMACRTNKPQGCLSPTRRVMRGW